MTGLPWWLSYGKESACSVGDLGSTPGLRRSPGGGHGNPLQYSFPENSHGQRSLAGYTPWGRKELDMTEQLTHEHTHIHSMCIIINENLNKSNVFILMQYIPKILTTCSPAAFV